MKCESRVALRTSEQQSSAGTPAFPMFGTFCAGRVAVSSHSMKSISSYEKSLYRLLIVCMLLFAAGGLLSDGLLVSLKGFLRLQMHSARLINDFTVVGGSGG